MSSHLLCDRSRLLALFLLFSFCSGFPFKDAGHQPPPWRVWHSSCCFVWWQQEGWPPPSAVRKHTGWFEVKDHSISREGMGGASSQWQHDWVTKWVLLLAMRRFKCPNFTSFGIELLKGVKIWVRSLETAVACAGEPRRWKIKNEKKLSLRYQQFLFLLRMSCLFKTWCKE